MDIKEKEALMAIGDQRVKLDVPNLSMDVFIRPIRYVDFFKLSSEAKGDTEEERSENFDLALCAHSMVGNDDEPIFTTEEYREFIGKTHYTIALAIVKARNAVNSFSELDSDTKKK